MRTITMYVAAFLFGMLLAACDPYRADNNGGRCDTNDDSVYVNDPAYGQAWFGDDYTGGGLYCFDNGDGYPTRYPHVTVPQYPTTGA